MLKKAYLEITNICNLSCSFCHKTKREKKMLSRNEFEVLTDKLKGKIKYLYFHLMGEPTLHPELPIFIDIAKQKGFTPIITTNGSLLGEKKQLLLSHIPHKMSISLHAPAANDLFAQPDYIKNCIDFAKAAATKGCFIAFRLWNLGSDGESQNEDILRALHEEFPKEWENARTPNVKKLDDKIFLEFAETFDWPDPKLNECPSDTPIFCYGLRDQIGILCDGTVVPCCLDADGNIPLGNLFNEELDSILSSERAQKMYCEFSRRRASESLCRKCGYAKRF